MLNDDLMLNDDPQYTSCFKSATLSLNEDCDLDVNERERCK